MKRKNIGIVLLLVCLASLTLLGYWASTQVNEGGIEEKFLSAVGLHAQEEEEERGLFGFVLEGNNPLLYASFIAVVLAIGILGYRASKPRIKK
jgi:hypothetical protein